MTGRVGRRSLLFGGAGMAGCCLGCAPKFVAQSSSPPPCGASLPATPPGTVAVCGGPGAPQAGYLTCSIFPPVDEPVRTVPARTRRQRDAPEAVRLRGACDETGWCAYEGKIDDTPIRVMYSLSDVRHALPPALHQPVVGTEPSVIIGSDLVLGRYSPDSVTPRHVQFIFLCAAYALRRFHALGFRPPLLREGVLVVELMALDFRGGTDSSHKAEDRIGVERSLIGQDAFLTVGHEIFHRIQYAYNPVLVPGGFGRLPFASHSIHALVREGGARLAEDWLLDEANRYVVEGRQWFDSPGLSLTQWRTPDSAIVGSGYSGGLFWKHVAEQHDGGASPRDRGARMMHAVLLATRSEKPDSQNIPYSVACLRRAWSVMTGPGHFDQFFHLSEDATPVCEETAWGNFLVALALNGSGGADSRFRFSETASWGEASRAQLRVPPEHSIVYGDLPVFDHGEPIRALTFSADTMADRRLRPRLREAILELAGNAPAANAPPPFRMLPPYAVAAFAVRMSDRDTFPSGATRLLRISFSPARGALRDSLVQVLVTDRGGRLIDLFRHDGSNSRSMNLILSAKDDSLVRVLVASREEGGDFFLSFSRVLDRPLLSATSWNRAVDTHYAEDPARYVWDWRSPDVDWASSARRLRFTVKNTGTFEARRIVGEARLALFSANGLFTGWSSPATIPTDGSPLPDEGSCFQPNLLSGIPSGCEIRENYNGSRTRRWYFLNWPNHWAAPSPLGDVVQAVFRYPDDPDLQTATILSAIGNWRPQNAIIQQWGGNLHQSI